METIKISLAKPIYSLKTLNINWGACKEEDGILTIVLNDGGTELLTVGDTILFRRDGTVENEYQYGSDGIVVDNSDSDEKSNKEILAEQEVKIVSILSDSEFTVEAPKKANAFCETCYLSISGETIGKYIVGTSDAHTIFYQDIAMAQSNPMKVMFNVYDSAASEYVTCASTINATNNEASTIGISATYTISAQTNCGANENVPYDYYFIPARESRLTFLSDKIIDENTVLYFSQNDFYFVDSNGNCSVWSDARFTPDGVPQTKVSVFKHTGYWDVPIGFTQNADYVHLYQEENINTLFADKIKKSVIPPIINMERVKYSPVIMEGNDVSIICGITFNLHFRERDENWNVIRPGGWNTCEPGDTDNENFNLSDSLCYLGFSDDDVQYQKMKVKKSFIRLSFYSTNDPLQQSLLYYSTIFLDSGYLFGQFNKERTKLILEGDKWEKEDEPSYVLQKSAEEGSEIRIDTQIVVHNEFDMDKSSEGFNLYLFADDSEIHDVIDGNEKDFRTIYMKVEFNHAGYGKTIPFVVWPNTSSNQISIEDYFNNVYIPVKIKHIDDRYYYYFDSNDFIKCNKEEKSITFNLFEPRLARES